MVEVSEFNLLARAKYEFERAKARKNDVAVEIHLKALNTAIARVEKAFEWTPSQAKLLKITMIMNELEGLKGKEVFETTNKDTLKLKLAKVMTKNLRKKYNEDGARVYVDKIKAVLEE